jgi:hypothetical protein
MTTNTSMVKLGWVLAITATVITLGTAGCSTNRSGTGTSPTTGTTSSAAATSATANARFVGHWHVHDATLDITPTTAAIAVSLGMGPCSQSPEAACTEYDTLGVVSGDDTQLTLTVTGVSYALHNGQTTTVNPSRGPSTAVGDSIQLVWQAPGLLKATLLKGFPGWQGGNPYWCGDGVSQSDLQRCGA